MYAMVPQGENDEELFDLLPWDSSSIVATKNDESLEMWFECDAFADSTISADDISVTYVLSSNNYWRPVVHVKSQSFCWHTKSNCKTTTYGVWDREYMAVPSGYLPDGTLTSTQWEGCPCDPEKENVKVEKVGYTMESHPDCPAEQKCVQHGEVVNGLATGVLLPTATCAWCHDGADGDVRCSGSTEDLPARHNADAFNQDHVYVHEIFQTYYNYF